MIISGWDRWQTYRKDRGTPPWIKVYRNLMSNQEWAFLSDSEKGQLVSLWILAADKHGSIPDDPKVLQKMCMLDTPPNISKFADLGFLVTACQPTGNQLETINQKSDAPETETETETEKGSSVDERSVSFRALDFLVSEGVEKQNASDWLKVRSKKRLANTESSFNKIFEQIKKKGLTIQEGIKICAEESWGGFKATWELPGRYKGQVSEGSCENCTGSFGDCPWRTPDNVPPPGKKCFNQIEGKR